MNLLRYAQALLMAVLTTGDIAQVRSVQILSKVEQVHSAPLPSLLQCRCTQDLCLCNTCVHCTQWKVKRGAEGGANYSHHGVLALAVQAWRHENAKTWQVLVSLTACMVASILARQDELNMKHPVVVSAVRAWFFLGERYRLPVLLRLHAICLVTRNQM